MLKRIAPALAALAMAAPAIAGDLPSVKDAPLPPPVFAYDWTGVYVGADLGGAWAQGKYSLGVYNNTRNGSSIMGGAFVGYNRQIGSFVLGVQGDVQGLGIDTNGLVFGYKQNLLAALNGRLGFAFDRVLVYAIGGVAFSDTKVLNVAGTYSDANVGYDVGGGLEYAFLPNWTVRGEYRYYNFGTFNGTYTAIAPVNFGFQKTDNTFNVGVAYKFGIPAPAPVVAKY
jgi:outer membrane immunogenic protein